MNEQDVKATWNEWSIHVLKELERLNDCTNDISTKVNNIEQKLIVLQATTANTNQMRDLIGTSLNPITLQLSQLNEERLKMRQTLYGIKDNNGLSGDVAELQKKVTGLIGFKKQIIAVMVVLQIALTIFGDTIIGFFRAK
jgi:hypothetical protein